MVIKLAGRKYCRFFIRKCEILELKARVIQGNVESDDTITFEVWDPVTDEPGYHRIDFDPSKWVEVGKWLAMVDMYKESLDDDELKWGSIMGNFSDNELT